MARGRRKSKLEKAQEKAWKFYQAWRKTGSVCPALSHRFEALPLAKKLIEQSTTYQYLTKIKRSKIGHGRFQKYYVALGLKQNTEIRSWWSHWGLVKGYKSL